MAKYYKLSEEIKQFIIRQKTINPKLSCRGLIPLIKETFQVNLSKSLINNVIKQNYLSSPKGRRRIRVVEIPKLTPETVIERKQPRFMENGGCFLLKAVDLRFSLTSNLAKALLFYFPNLSKQSLEQAIETFIYSPLFKDKRSLDMFIGKRVVEESLSLYSQQMLQFPLYQLKEVLVRLEINHNISEINELYKKCLWRLNSYLLDFFPPEYQFLDFQTMQERFYSLPAKIERRPGFLAVHLFYRKGFSWVNDIIWQEGFSYVTNKLNNAKILNKDSQQIWFNPQPSFLEGNAFLAP